MIDEDIVIIGTGLSCLLSLAFGWSRVNSHLSKHIFEKRRKALDELASGVKSELKTKYTVHRHTVH